MHSRPLLNVAAYTYLFVMLALLFFPLISHAQNPALSSTPPAGKVLVNQFVTRTGQNVYTYAAMPAPLGLDAKMWNDALAVDTYSALDVGDGVKAPIGARAVPSKPDVAKAVGNFARGIGGAALKTAGAVYAAGEVAKALNDLCNDLGYSCYKGSSGGVEVTKSDLTLCTVAPCYQYRMNDQSPWFRNPEQVVDQVLSTLNDQFQNSRFERGFWNSTDFSRYAVAIYNRAGDTTTLQGYQNVTIQRTGATVQPNVQQPSSIEALEADIAAKSGWPSSTSLPKVVEQAVASGEPLPLPVPSQVTGPATIPMVPTITQLPDGSSTTVTPEKRLTFGQLGGAPTVTVTDGKVTTTTSPQGVTTVISSGSSPANLPAPAPEIKIETCGLPGKPACKIDETGTSSPIAATGYDTALDPFKQQTDEKRDVIAGTADKSFFASWSMFFAAPAMVQCEPMVMPNYLGMSLGTLDPCPVAGGMREVMAYIWALGGLWLCLGMIKGVM